MKRTFTYFCCLLALALSSCSGSNRSSSSTPGYSLTLEIDGDQVIRDLATRKADFLFENALEKARDSPKREEIGWVNAFFEAMVASDEEVQLARYFAKTELPISNFFFQQPILTFNGRPTQNSSNEEVIEWLKKEFDKVVERTFLVLRRRIDKLRVAETYVIELLKDRDRIQIEIPAEGDYKRLRSGILASTHLGFWKAEMYGDCQPLLYAINAFHGGTTEPVHFPRPSPPNSQDSLPPGQEEDSNFLAENPFLSLFDQSRPLSPDWHQVGYAKLKDTARINAMISAAEKENLIGHRKFLWMAQPEQNEASGGEKTIGLVCVVANDEGVPDLDGNFITSARAEPDQLGGFRIDITMNAEGTKLWSRLTREQIGKPIAIVLNGQVLSAPRVQGAITGGQSQITGNFTFEEAQDLATQLEAGVSPALVRVVEEVYPGE